jgi:hypothetical protein
MTVIYPKYTFCYIVTVFFRILLRGMWVCRLYSICFVFAGHALDIVVALGWLASAQFRVQGLGFGA